ncbi:MAG: glycosyltransferase family 1 protein [Deltaproteobacteria bacterium]|nr:glycosyltransferase family 1 protein [Deltaproteobacteria bacterium]
MRLLILYHQTAPRHVMYLRRLAANMEAEGHVLYGPQCKDFEAERPIEEVIKACVPVDGILVMEPKFARWLLPLKSLKIPKALILSDYYPRKQGWQQTHLRLDLDRYDLVFAQTLYEFRAFRENGRKERVIYLPMSVDTTYFTDQKLARDIDVMACWGMNPAVYPHRRAVRDKLAQLNCKISLRQVFYGEYVTALNRAKIFVNSGTVFRNIQSRFTEVMACGCLLISNNVDDAHIQGFRPGHHFVTYKSLRELVRQINYYLKWGAERERIARNGQEHVIAKHSNRIRIKEITQIMERI